MSNGLLKGSALEPTLLDFYVRDLQQAVDRKFNYDDDMECPIQLRLCHSTKRNEQHIILSSNLKIWSRKPGKIECCLSQLYVSFEVMVLKNNSLSKYIGFTIDHTLTFIKVIINTGGNVMQNLAGTGWRVSCKSPLNNILESCRSYSDAPQECSCLNRLTSTRIFVIQPYLDYFSPNRFM